MTNEEQALHSIECLPKHLNQNEIQMLFDFANNPPDGSARVRNAASIALADHHVAGADTFLINLLKRSETKNARGTLLYALEEMGIKVPLSLLVSIIGEGAYEAREMAFDLISESLFTVESPAQRSELAAKLRAVLQEHADDKELSEDILFANERLGEP